MASQWGKFALSDSVRIGLGTGLLGGFTTFFYFRSRWGFIASIRRGRARCALSSDERCVGFFCAYLGIKCVESMGV